MHSAVLTDRHATAHSDLVVPSPGQRQSSWRVYKSQKAKSSKILKCDHAQLCPPDHLLESFSLEPKSFLTGRVIYEYSWLMSHRQVPARTLSSISLQVTYLGVLSPFCETLTGSPSTLPPLLSAPNPPSHHIYTEKCLVLFGERALLPLFYVWWFNSKQKVPAGFSEALCSRQTHGVRLLPAALWAFNPRVKVPSCCGSLSMDL